jgi:hypothetical protein
VTVKHDSRGTARATGGVTEREKKELREAWSRRWKARWLESGAGREEVPERMKEEDMWRAAVPIAR